eukprot:4887005-Amphidinium_carterae.1
MLAEEASASSSFALTSREQPKDQVASSHGFWTLILHTSGHCRTSATRASRLRSGTLWSYEHADKANYKNASNGFRHTPKACCNHCPRQDAHELYGMSRDWQVLSNIESGNRLGAAAQYLGM